MLSVFAQSTRHSHAHAYVHADAHTHKHTHKHTHTHKHKHTHTHTPTHRSLFETLPNFRCHGDPVRFSAALNVSSTKKVTVSNPSKEVVNYKPLLLGSNSFKLSCDTFKVRICTLQFFALINSSTTHPPPPQTPQPPSPPQPQPPSTGLAFEQRRTHLWHHQIPLPAVFFNRTCFFVGVVCVFVCLFVCLRRVTRLRFCRLRAKEKRSSTSCFSPYHTAHRMRFFT